MPRHVVLALALAFELAAPSAHAFFDPPWITPTTPRAGEVVSVNIHGGICDGIVEHPGYPQITRNGNAIRIVEYGVHVDFEDFCIYPSGNYSETLGPFPPGDYTLTVDFMYDDYPFGFTTITLGVVLFTVTDVALSKPVPTLTFAWKLVLAAGVLSVARRALAVQRKWSE